MLFGLTVAVLIFACSATPQERKRPSAAVVQVKQIADPFLAEIALFGRSLPTSKSNAISIVTYDVQSEGCQSWKPSVVPQSAWYAVVQRGNCSFLNKSVQAGKSGASGIFIVSQDDQLAAMYADPKDLERLGGNDKVIPTLMVTRRFYTQILPIPDPQISLYTYLQQMWDPTMLIVAVIATAVVVGGAFYSSDFERAQYHGLTRTFRERQETQEVTQEMAWGFVAVASIGLVLLFYFMNQLFYVILFVFVMGSANGLSNIGTHIIEFYFPETHFRFISLYFEFRLSEVIASVPSLILCVVWFFVRKQKWGWVLQDIMCVGLLMLLQRVLKFPNLRISAILLCTAFFYDIFWVFLSPFFFKTSVMVEVARGGDTGEMLPMLIAVPRINDPFHSPMMLGLGDMALPGLLVSYLLRFDYLAKFPTWGNGYFVWSTIGYFIGLLFTYVSLVLMQHGQPALLFLVPCTLGTTALLAWQRNQLHEIWSGEIGAKASEAKENEEIDPTENQILLEEDPNDVPLV